MMKAAARAMVGVCLAAAILLVACSDEPDAPVAQNGRAPSHNAEAPAQLSDPPLDQPARATDKDSTGSERAIDLAPPQPMVVDDLAREMALVDESLDDFPTEQINVSAGGQLDRLAAALEARTRPSSVEGLFDEGVECAPLRPGSLEQRFDDGLFRVVRGDPVGDMRRGADRVDEAFDQLLAELGNAEIHVKFKIDRVELLSDGLASTRVIYLGMGDGAERAVQQNARWNVMWDVSAGLDVPRVKSIEAHDFEQILVPHTVFGDCTRSALQSEQLVDTLSRGVDYWWGKVDVSLPFDLYGDYGIALGDVNGDGLDDLYICMPGSFPNLLLKHNPDGTVTDISAGSGVNLLNNTSSALFADLDNDGHQDLVLGAGQHVELMRGGGQGVFTHVGSLDTSTARALSVVDIDGDSLLDLYICRFAESRSEGGDGSFFDSDRGGSNVMYRNEGGFRFTDVTAEVGLDENNSRYSFAAAWEDYDNDGDLDLYVANDFGRNNLYRNDAGMFSDVAREAGVEDQAAGMGVSWADFDHDGHIDLYVSNMFSSAGGRVTYQRQFAVDGEQASVAQRFARGNSLFRNLGDGTFADVSEAAGVMMGRWSWGAEFVDINNDGADDVLVPNGYVTNHITKDL